MPQLPLAVTLDAHASFATFVAGSSNEPAIEHVRALSTAQSGEIVWVWGSRGCGKSHLLQAACRAADAAGKRSMYLALGSDPEIVPELLADLDALDLLALDQVDRAAGSPAWESRLFAVLNGFQSREGCLLMAAADAPSAVGFSLADLASRATGAVVYRLRPLAEQERIEALLLHARHRGLELDAAAARYLQARVARDMPTLCAWLSKLDEASLAAQRKLTIPFIREWLVASEAASSATATTTRTAP
jgi:DnaA-homolog protein